MALFLAFGAQLADVVLMFKTARISPSLPLACATRRSSAQLLMIIYLGHLHFTTDRTTFGVRSTAASVTLSGATASAAGTQLAGKALFDSGAQLTEPAGAVITASTMLDDALSSPFPAPSTLVRPCFAHTGSAHFALTQIVNAEHYGALTMSAANDLLDVPSTAAQSTHDSSRTRRSCRCSICCVSADSSLCQTVFRSFPTAWLLSRHSRARRRRVRRPRRRCRARRPWRPLPSPPQSSVTTRRRQPRADLRIITAWRTSTSRPRSACVLHLVAATSHGAHSSHHLHQSCLLIVSSFDHSFTSSAQARTPPLVAASCELPRSPPQLSVSSLELSHPSIQLTTSSLGLLIAAARQRFVRAQVLTAAARSSSRLSLLTDATRHRGESLTAAARIFAHTNTFIDHRRFSRAIAAFDDPRSSMQLSPRTVRNLGSISEFRFHHFRLPHAHFLPLSL